jgi:hypothetical protein
MSISGDMDTVENSLLSRASCSDCSMTISSRLCLRFYSTSESLELIWNLWQAAVVLRLCTLYTDRHCLTLLELATLMELLHVNR